MTTPRSRTFTPASGAPPESGSVTVGASGVSHHGVDGSGARSTRRGRTAGDALMRIETPGISTAPSSGWVNLTRIPFAATVSWWNHSARERTGPQGTSAASRSASHSARLRRRNAASSKRSRDLRAGRDRVAARRSPSISGSVSSLREHAGHFQRTEVDGLEQPAEKEPLTVRALVQAVVGGAADGCAPQAWWCSAPTVSRSSPEPRPATR